MTAGVCLVTFRRKSIAASPTGDERTRYELCNDMLLLVSCEWYRQPHVTAPWRKRDTLGAADRAPCGAVFERMLGDGQQNGLTPQEKNSVTRKGKYRSPATPIAYKLNFLHLRAY